MNGKDLLSRNDSRIGYHSDDDRGRTVIDDVRVAPGAPVDVAASPGTIHRFVPFSATASTTTTTRLTAAIVVRNEVGLSIGGIPAFPDPGDRGRYRTRRATVLRAPTTAAEKPVDPAIAPVLAGLRITGILFGPRTRSRRLLRFAFPARHGQQRDHHSTNQYNSHCQQRTPARQAARECSNSALIPAVKPVHILLRLSHRDSCGAPLVYASSSQPLEPRGRLSERHARSCQPLTSTQCIRAALSDSGRAGRQGWNSSTPSAPHSRAGAFGLSPGTIGITRREGCWAE